MKAQSHRFKANSQQALRDADLQAALGRAKSGFVDKRAKAIDALPEFEALRERGRQVRAHSLAYLDVYLERFSAQVEHSGGRVHWASDADEARRHIVDICQRQQARLVIKSKTMVGEEIAINEALEEAAIEVVETDLGEYIIQLAKEPPSHIIAPAVHKTRDQISSLFDRVHHQRQGQPTRAVPDLVDEARQVLRKKFRRADVGITGANFLIAEEGSALIVTNEGNADLCMSLPRVHIVLTSIDKLVPTLEDASTLVRLLGRSATGQPMTTYTTLVTGARRANDTAGPEEFHVVLLDNGRSQMLDGPFREMLHCIRCGACLNHCPVYSAIGGHAYGWVYPGPMGSVLTPHFIGLDKSKDLPHACTLNGRCEAVCPVKIPLPKLLRRLRAASFEQGLTQPVERSAVGLWGKLAQRPVAYRAATAGAHRILRVIQRLDWQRPPFLGAWTAHRSLPHASRETFVSTWHRQREKTHER
ncbi:iron-sulfur cluster-binding protein [Alkalilimnicola ehrlichii]|uniref:Iron-sulfur cluster-binding protein n=1 Tax=Alkalilimnicola ehrlichii TaxID=351052 RepID=A0A3E0WHM9_9GAMM|nr:LutB/LldF family L-lactate oxidation iron-sulfur protein [Alkalilimnicola ehrlichii]RFA28310.1 iron-sulfur cluster-binding protein [Alkalilimnicola ehrlichii]RFA31647.1 iron-sulfur cluster-binding protein [Alkalilimnicola ehrlichii]